MGNRQLKINAPIKGGSAGKGWGFDQEVKILVNCPRVGSIRSPNVVKNPHLGQIPNKRRAVLIPFIYW